MRSDVPLSNAPSPNASRRGSGRGRGRHGAVSGQHTELREGPPHDHGGDDEHGREADRRGHRQERQRHQPCRPQGGELSPEETALQAAPQQECHRHCEHDQVVEIEIRRGEHRAGCHGRRFDLEARAAAPQCTERNRDRRRQAALHRPREALGTAEPPDAGEQALQLGEAAAPLGESGLRYRRQAAKEGLPCAPAESEHRHRGKQGNCRRRRRNDTPARTGDQHQGKQEAEMRLEREQPQQAAREPWPPLHGREGAAQQCRRETSVLPDGHVGQHAGKDEGEKDPDPMADDRPHRPEIG